jgi:hypothetical protein
MISVYNLHFIAGFGIDDYSNLLKGRAELFLMITPTKQSF